MDVAQANILDIVSAVFSFIATVLSVVAFVHSFFSEARERKALTIEQHHRISEKDGSLWWFYHMSEEEREDNYFLANLCHHSLRTIKKEEFIHLEDMLGVLDEFGSAIDNKLYDFETFKKLAGNYCKDRVIPNIAKLLRTYDIDSYKNIKRLVIKLNAKETFDEKAEKRSYKFLESIPRHMEEYYKNNVNEKGKGEVKEYCYFLDLQFDFFVHDELKELRVELNEEETQKLEEIRINSKNEILKDDEDFFDGEKHYRDKMREILLPEKYRSLSK